MAGEVILAAGLALFAVGVIVMVWFVPRYRKAKSEAAA